jgi:hypothetical protein
MIRTIESKSMPYANWGIWLLDFVFFKRCQRNLKGDSSPTRPSQKPFSFPQGH